MKLAFSPASPYVRKCMASAIARGIEGQVELWTVPTVDPSLVPVNPLSKVPSLVTPEGQCLYDSPVICEYLDSVGTAPGLFPAPGPARWNALRQQALGDGIMDATQPRRREVVLPQDEGRITYIQGQQLKVTRALDALEAEADTLGLLTTIGEITIACALGYLDFRFGDEDWRVGRPKLTEVYNAHMANPVFAETVPVG
eukprot:gene51270-62700_t